MPNVCTLRQRGISSPAPARPGRSSASPSRREGRVTATGTRREQASAWGSRRRRSGSSESVTPPTSPSAPRAPPRPRYIAERDLIIFCTFAVILVTLLVQGLSLPPLIRMLGIEDDDEVLRRIERELDLEDSRLEI